MLPEKNKLLIAWAATEKIITSPVFLAGGAIALAAGSFMEFVNGYPLGGVALAYASMRTAIYTCHRHKLDRHKKTLSQYRLDLS